MGKIYLFGQRNITGGGTHFSNFADTIRTKITTDVSIIEVDTTSSDSEKMSSFTTRDDISIIFYRTHLDPLIKGSKVKWGIFETDSLDKEYLRYLDDSEQIWVPSRWAQSVLVNHSINVRKILVVPEGVDIKLFHPIRLKCEPVTSPFKFLSVAKKETRKGLSELLMAFKMAFENDPGYQLILKSGYYSGGQGTWEKKKLELDQEIYDLQLTNVFQIDQPFNKTDLQGLYQKAHAFVFPSRAEGWGLPLIEALACGLPSIAMNYSGQTEFLRHVEGLYYELDFSLETINCGEFQYMWGHGGRWAVATPADISKAMKDIASNYERYFQKAIRAHEIITKEFCWSKVSDIASDNLQQLLLRK